MALRPLCPQGLRAGHHDRCLQVRAGRNEQVAVLDLSPLCSCVYSFGEHDLVANFRERSLAKTLQLAIEAICLGSILWPAEEAALATSSIPLFAFYSLLLMLLAETANSLSFLRARDSGLGSLMAWLSLTARVVRCLNSLGFAH